MTPRSKLIKVNTIFFAFFAKEDPISFDEAHKQEKWIQAMDGKMRAIKKMTHGAHKSASTQRVNWGCEMGLQDKEES